MESIRCATSMMGVLRYNDEKSNNFLSFKLNREKLRRSKNNGHLESNKALQWKVL